jgi:hypothetical protein
MRRMLAISVLLLSVACNETQHRVYPTRQEAVADGAIDRGWVPKWLPPSATDIREVHNIDSNATLMTFRFERTDLSRMVSDCESTTGMPHELPAGDIASSVPWWPEFLNAQSTSALPQGQYFRCPETTQYGDGHSETRGSGLVIPSASDVAYFWR